MVLNLSGFIVVGFFKRLINMNRIFFVFYFLIFSTFFSEAFAEKEKVMTINNIVILKINSAITPATKDYIQENLSKASEHSLFIIKLNTPGGLVVTTKDIISLISNSNHPVAIWIAPEGAAASSAGALIATSAPFIFMSPGTIMGAATPINLGSNIAESDGRNKIINDLKAMVRSMSQLHNRPGVFFEDMITTARSFTDQEAMKLELIDGIVSTPTEMIPALTKKSVNILGTQYKLNIDHVFISEVEPTIGQKILEVLANPSASYFLFLLGIALIYFEFQAPGGYIAGAAGFSLVIISAIAFQVLPLHWGAFSLIICGAILLIMDLYLPSHGLLSISGLIATLLGSLFLFHNISGFIEIKYSVILSCFLGIALPLVFMLWYTNKHDVKHLGKDDFFAPIGALGTIVAIEESFYQIKVNGQFWRALSEEALSVGDQIEVIEKVSNQLMVKIKKYR
jgi:membrane-bound serine protease (ClpP class)